MRSFAHRSNINAIVAGLGIRGTVMESWRMVWREGFAPVLPTEGLEALWLALQTDDPSLTQGCTSTPPPLMCMQDWDVEGCCALGYCGWKGEGLNTVGQVEEFFARSCFEADQRLGEPAGCRWFLNWYDDTPREEMVHELLGEVERTLRQRFDIDMEPSVQRPTRRRRITGKNIAAA